MTEIALESENWSRLNTSTLADVLDDFGINGVLPSCMRRVGGVQGLKYGRAYTVRWAPTRKQGSILAPQPSTWQQVRDFLVPNLRNAKGLVYVAGGGPLISEAALAGGLSSTYFQSLGFEAVVLGGAIRDAETLATLELPIVASGFTPTDTQGSHKVTEVGGSCSIEHVQVQTGDWVFSDGSGTVVVPQKIAGDVIARALAIDSQEDAMLEQIRAGVSLVELIEKNGRI